MSDTAGRIRVGVIGGGLGGLAAGCVLAARGYRVVLASDHIPHGLDDERVAWTDVVVARCDDACPAVPGKRYVSWNLPDPMGRSLEEVRTIRDNIARRVEELADELDDAGNPTP